MSERSEPNVGLRIRALREQRKLSLRALSARCGLSVNAISRIELGENSPTVSSLHLLAKALDVPITAFFEERKSETTVFVKRDSRLYYDGGGMMMESLGIGLRNQRLEPFLVTVEPGSGHVDEPITHAGQEFVYCLQGEIEYTVGEASYRMEAGDSLLFEAEQPHHFYNSTQTASTILLVFHTMQGSYLARQSHLSPATPQPSDE